MRQTFYPRFGKRVLDVAGSSVGLVLLAPVFLIIAVLVKATSRGPVFFRQIRAGQFDKTFRIFKFRSMSGRETGPGAQLTKAGDPRITPLGRLLRKSKADELPQLINVFLGQMSLVGPRPEVPEYVATYSHDQRRVLLAKPGITGLVAMNNVGEEELLAAQEDKHYFYQAVLLPAKLKLDLQYCEDIRLFEDLRILFGTFFKIFHRSPGVKSQFIHTPEKQT
jgi:lipopolysaccharide/colanic/teichoic acid biosynthesis glycosyltransferase